jgi:hypothetical protein
MGSKIPFNAFISLHSVFYNKRAINGNRLSDFIGRYPLTNRGLAATTVINGLNARAGIASSAKMPAVLL